MGKSMISMSIFGGTKGWRHCLSFLAVIASRILSSIWGMGCLVGLVWTFANYVKNSSPTFFWALALSNMHTHHALSMHGLPRTTAIFAKNIRELIVPASLACEANKVGKACQHGTSTGHDDQRSQANSSNLHTSQSFTTIPSNLRDYLPIVGSLRMS